MLVLLRISVHASTHDDLTLTDLLNKNFRYNKKAASEEAAFIKNNFIKLI
jgi:hypothetical protein